MTSQDWALPRRPAWTLLRWGGLRVFPLLTRSRFAEFCRKREINLSVERLERFEALGLLAPMFLLDPPAHIGALRTPLSAHSQWFRRGWALETLIGGTARPCHPDQECYYSRFQIWDAALIESFFTLEVHTDSYLVPTTSGKKKPLEARITEMAQRELEGFRATKHRGALAWFVQFVSDQYGPYARSDMRRLRVPLRGGGFVSRHWVHHDASWDWYEQRRGWDAESVANRFGVTAEMVREAYEGLAVTGLHDDPLGDWYNLVQFVRVDRRERLRGKALGAETYREALYILDRFHRDLTGRPLAHPHEVGATIITRFPETSVRDDIRQYLEYVVNQYGLNPRPAVALFVEGESEARAISLLFERYFGAHQGKFFIEIINLGGVDTATGGKSDRFRAIFRLIDYLHHHQTICFLLLDNEGHARNLKTSARNAKSTLSRKRYVTRQDYIKVWRRTFEFDNFSDSELAAALSAQIASEHRVTVAEVRSCRASRSADPLAKLFRDKAGIDLNKPAMAEYLVVKALSPATRRDPANRPIIAFLQRVATSAVRNPPPTLKSTWEKNQASKFLGKKRS